MEQVSGAKAGSEKVKAHAWSGAVNEWSRSLGYAGSVALGEGISGSNQYGEGVALNSVVFLFLR